MLRFLPWKFIVQRTARSYGVLDPALWLARLRQFSQPSEVQEPIELLRAGILFHARGIVNTKAIQHNLDWVWPYWVERQFDPDDVSFIPRAFSFSHVNLTHRNWTAIGLPEMSIYPLVDPRGLVTPLFDGWSIDCWLFDGQGAYACLPSRVNADGSWQTLNVDGDLVVRTTVRHGDLELVQSARVILERGEPVVEIDVRAASHDGGALVASIRPYNAEGVQFIDRIAARDSRDGWRVNEKTDVIMDRPADRLLASDYANGDVFSLLSQSAVHESNGAATHQVKCATGMATAASVYGFKGPETRLTIRVPLGDELAAVGNPKSFVPSVSWQAVRAEAASLRIPDERMQFLYDAAVSTLVLLSADEIVPGPYTYRRFWFRDACLMIHALLALGFTQRCRRSIDRFGERQLRNGYFRSQEGEWDSNGQVLWILERYAALTGEPLPDSLLDSAARAVRWIADKRLPTDGDALHAGLLPPGFSAEHLGPNDYYYWDDFWAEAGLRAAGRLFRSAGRAADALHAEQEADDLRWALDRSLEGAPPGRTMGGMPASPHRRLDAGAIGSLVADYPLHLLPAGAPRTMATVEYLLRNCLHDGGFFQDVIHSGVNAYLTLDIAETLLRAGDERFRELVTAVARIASPTGQWPEAIHPQTGGGCMGDGQHGWAAAEWAMMIRNMFVREEENRLIIGSGLFPEWLAAGSELSFGATLTPWGRVSVRIERESASSLAVARIDAHWHVDPPRVDVALPGFQTSEAVDVNSPVRLTPVHEAAAQAPDVFLDFPAVASIEDAEGAPP